MESDFFVSKTMKKIYTFFLHNVILLFSADGFSEFAVYILPVKSLTKNYCSGNIARFPRV